MQQELEFELPLPSPHLSACIIIPARNEAEGIQRTLYSFLCQVDLSGEPLKEYLFEILLLANNCSDQTAHRARAWQAAHPKIRLHVLELTLAPELASVGHARRILMDLACSRLESISSKSKGPTAICSTDADTHVSPDWIAQILKEVSDGAMAVGGRILVDDQENDRASRLQDLDTEYRLLVSRLEAQIDPSPVDPAPRHFQFFGASLAITPEAYRRVGGLPSVRCLEDMELNKELFKRDIAIRHSPRVTVRTSARRQGRVEMGLSTQLQEWTDLEGQGKDWLVPSASEIQLKASLQRQLRDLHSTQQSDRHLKVLAGAARLNPGRLRELSKNARHFGELWEVFWPRVLENPAYKEAFLPVTVECAISQLKTMLASLSHSPEVIEPVTSFPKPVDVMQTLDSVK